MAAPENLRRGILPINAPTRERTAPVLPKPQARPSPEASLKPKKGKERKGIGTKARIALAGLAVLGTVETTGAVIAEQTNNQPLSAHTIPADLAWPWNLGKSAAEDIQGFFNPRSSSIEQRFPIVLPKEGFTPVTIEEERLLWQNTKTVDLEKHTFTIGFPVDQATIDQSPNLRMNQEFGTYTFTPAEIKKLQKEGFKTDTQLSGFPKDTKIYYRYDSTKFDASIIKIAIAGERQGEGSNSFTPAYTALRIIFRDKTTGKQYGEAINVLYGKPLVNPALFPTDHHPVYEDGTPIKPDQPILQLTTDLQDWDGKGQVLPGQKGQIVLGGISDMGPGVDPNMANFLTPSFLTSPSRNTIATKH